MVTINGVLEKRLCDSKVVGHFVQIHASGPVTVHNAMQPDQVVVAPHPGLVLLFDVIWILPIQDVANGGIVMSKFLGQNAGLTD